MEQFRPYAYIVEQPARCGVRFRYECENRRAGVIPGQHSLAEVQTYPTVAVANYSGPIRVIVSTVNKDPPYRPHPHDLVHSLSQPGISCSQGVCVATFAQPYAVFNNLAILTAKRKDVRERLRVREQLQIDPFGTGFNHRCHGLKLIDFNAVRLCFQVFLMEGNSGKYNIALEPVVSNEIFDKKAMSELSIARLSHTSAHIGGGQSVVMLCDRVLKEDIQIRFYQTDSATGLTVWERMAHFNASDIHKHFAIVFRVPAYDGPTTAQAHLVSKFTVKVQLYRPSDGCTSQSVKFTYLTGGELGSSEAGGSSFSSSSSFLHKFPPILKENEEDEEEKKSEATLQPLPLPPLLTAGEELESCDFSSEVMETQNTSPFGGAFTFPSLEASNFNYFFPM